MDQESTFVVRVKSATSIIQHGKNDIPEKLYTAAVDFLTDQFIGARFVAAEGSDND